MFIFMHVYMDVWLDAQSLVNNRMQQHMQLGGQDCSTFFLATFTHITPSCVSVWLRCLSCVSMEGTHSHTHSQHVSIFWLHHHHNDIATEEWESQTIHHPKLDPSILALHRFIEANGTQISMGCLFSGVPERTAWNSFQIECMAQEARLLKQDCF